MSPLVQVAIGFGAGLLGYLGPEVTVRLISAYRNRERFHPPSCYVCGHPGPMGELAPNLPCCAPCREMVMREADAVLDPWWEAREREERAAAAVRAHEDFAAKMGLPQMTVGQVMAQASAPFRHLLPSQVAQQESAATVLYLIAKLSEDE